MTLVGRTQRIVSFNFPISERCATILRAYYRLDDIGPVDPSLEPRRPGRYLGLNFSGGTDSTALYLLLREVLGEDFRVITCDFGPRFRLEQTGYGPFHRDVTCRTDIRERGFDRHGRFIAAAALLHADYLDLRAVASGHTVLHDAVSFQRAVEGEPPNYRDKDPVYLAGGLEEAHIVRGLQTPGILRLIIDLAPEQMEAAFAASARPITEKYYSRAVWARQIYRELRLPLPDFLRALPAPTIRWRHNPGQRYSLFTLWALKYEGIESVRPINPRIDAIDFGFLEALSLRFMLKYNTTFVPLLPEDLRARFLAAFHRHEIYPYTEHDWREVDVVRHEMFAPPR